jgi:hypothetical protein
MKRKESKCRALGLLIGALLGLICGSAQAAEPEPWVKFAPAVEAGKSSNTVNFGGHQWIIVGTDEDGVGRGTNDNGIKSASETITLLLKNHDIGFGEELDWTHFRTESDNNGVSGLTVPGFTEYSNWGWYYADNPCGPSDSECSDPEWKNWDKPSDYRGSTLQQAMEKAAATLSDEELRAIAPRTLTADDDTTSWAKITGGAVDDQKFWALSYDEWYQLTSQDARAYALYNENGEYPDPDDWSSAWWLRSPVYDISAIFGLPGGAG